MGATFQQVQCLYQGELSLNLRGWSIQQQTEPVVILTFQRMYGTLSIQHLRQCDPESNHVQVRRAVRRHIILYIGVSNIHQTNQRIPLVSAEFC